MDYLAHWDFADEFYGYCAAALILGIEPNEPHEGDKHRILIVKDRMARSYCAALERWGGFELSPRNTGELECVAMVKMEDIERWKWANNSLTKSSRFEFQQFSRAAIAQWLREIGLTSIYQFDKGSEKPPTKPLGRWPWGDYTTAALEHLSAAAHRFWVNYDPTDITTAPKNEDVAIWLVSNRGVSSTLAGYMASILRADNLPTGPRK